MKFWKVLIGLLLLGLLLVPAMHAQVPFYDYPNSIYYSGNIYPQPYYPLSLYALDPYSASSSDSIYALTRQVQQLGADVQRLQAQIALAQLAQAQAQLAPQRVVALATLAPEPAKPVVLILNNGTELIASGYAVSGETVWILNPTGTVRVALSELNLAATRRANASRKVTFENGR